LSGVATECFAGPVHAQTAAPAATSPAPQNSQIQDIVVTAQRRSESLEKVPVAITAITGARSTQQGITQPLALVSKVPGLSISTGNGPVSIIYIRGIGTSVNNLYGDNAVAFNVDGIVPARATGLSNQMFYVSRVEVLKGPKGALYGRNATGCAIKIVTNRPTFDRLSGDAAFEVGNYGLVTGDLAFKLPLSDNAGVRVAGRLTHRDGYFTDGTEDDKSGSARVRLRNEPTSNLSIMINGDYSHQHNNRPGFGAQPVCSAKQSVAGRMNLRLNKFKNPDFMRSLAPTEAVS
jgi:iron complex outermembrane receptor protein